MDMADAYRKGFEKFVNITDADKLKKNMLFISLFVLLYGYFCKRFVVPIKKKRLQNVGSNVCSNEITEADVLSAVTWLTSARAISDEETSVFKEIIAKWNRYVYEMPEQLYDVLIWNKTDSSLYSFVNYTRK